MYHMWKNETDNKILKLLACSRNSNIIQNYLNLTVSAIEKLNFSSTNDISLLRAKNLINGFLFTIAKHARSADIYTKYILVNNFKNIHYREGNIIATLIIVINNVYSVQDLDEANISLIYMH